MKRINIGQTRPFVKDEIEESIFLMHPLKASENDGILVVLYQEF